MLSCLSLRKERISPLVKTLAKNLCRFRLILAHLFSNVLQNRVLSFTESLCHNRLLHIAFFVERALVFPQDCKVSKGAKFIIRNEFWANRSGVFIKKTATTMRHTLKKPQKACLETLCERQEKTMCSNCVAHRFSNVKNVYIYPTVSVPASLTSPVPIVFSIRSTIVETASSCALCDMASM